MRRLGAALNVEAMSLYAHVGSKDELLDRLGDRVMHEVVMPNGPDSVQSAMELARGFRATLLAHPNLMPVLARRRTGPSDPGLTKRNVALAFARDAGLDPDFAVIAYMTIVSFVAGHVITHTGLLGADASRDDLEGPDPDRAFEEGLAAIVDGLLSRAGDRERLREVSSVHRS